MAFFELYLKKDLSAANLIWGSGIIQDRRLTRPIQRDPQISLEVTVIDGVVSPSDGASLELTVANQQVIPSSFSLLLNSDDYDSFEVKAEIEETEILRKGERLKTGASVDLDLAADRTLPNFEGKSFTFVVVAEADDGTAVFSEEILEIRNN